MKTMAKAEFIEKSNMIHGNKYDYSQVTFLNARTKVRIQCIKGHSFDQIPRDHYNGAGCPFCFGNRKLTKAFFVVEAEKTHGTKYDYVNVEITGTNKKVEILCKKHGPFYQTPNNHISKRSGCPSCRNETRFLTLEEFIKKANTIHRNKYNYSNVQLIGGVKSKIIILCPFHGEYSQMVSNHLAGSGCKLCAKIIQASQRGFQFLQKNPHLKNHPTCLYLIHFSNTTDNFLKIGITLHRPKTRYRSPQYKSFTKDILYTEMLPFEQAITAERNILQLFSRYERWSNLVFDGKTETIDPNQKTILL